MSRRLIFEGKKVRLAVEEVELPGGRRVEREIVEHPGACVVLPMRENGAVVLESHYRFTIGQWLLEAPAGTLERGEDPAAAAARELAEETGLAAREIVPLGRFYSSPGVMTELMYAYLARGLESRPDALEEDEVLTVVEMPFEEALAKAADGGIRDAKTIATLFLAKSYLDRERSGK